MDGPEGVANVFAHNWKQTLIVTVEVAHFGVRMTNRLLPHSTNKKPVVKSAS